MQYLKLILTSLAVTALAACSLQQAPGPFGQPLPDEQMAGALPLLDELRGTAAVSTTKLYGHQFSQKALSASPVGNKLYLFADPGQLCWGIWSFQQGMDYLSALDVNVTAQAGNEWWLALADYEAGRWQFSGPFEGNQSVELSKAYASPAGGCHVAILTHDFNYVELDSLDLQTDDGWQLTDFPKLLFPSVQPAEGRMLDAMLVDGRPAVAIGLQTAGISYAILEQGTGELEEDWFLASVDGSQQFPNVSLAMVGGHPAIVGMSGQKRLTYYRSMEADGAGNWQGRVLEQEYSGSYAQPSLAEVQGRPAVAYFSEHNDLFYLRAKTASGLDEDWELPQAVYSPGGEAGTAAELMLVNGHPAIAFYSKHDMQGMYIRSSNPTGIGGSAWAMAPLQLGQYHSQFSMALVDNNPALAMFESAGAASLRFVRSLSITGTQQADWSQQQVVDEAPNNTFAGTGQFPSMQLVSGLPAIAYRDLDSQKLRYAQALPSQDSSYGQWRHMTVDDKAGSGYSASMLTLADGSPAIFYLDNQSAKLRYAWRRPAN